MEKVKFTCRGYVGDNLDAEYACNKPGDQSGEYVRAEVAEKLLAALIDITDAGIEAWGNSRPCVKIACATIANAKK